MPTNRDIVNNIRSYHRLLAADAVINDRVVFSEMRSAVLYLLRQQTDKRKLFGSPNIFTILPCLEMEEAPLAECCDFTSDIYVSKSKVEIPRIAESIYGLLVQQVASVDRMNQFIWVTPRRLSNILKLGIRKNEVYWLMYNSHIYVTNKDTRLINVTAFFEEDVPSELLYPVVDCDCKPSATDDELCMNPLDREFKCPGFLIDAVQKMVSQKLLSTYFKIKQDPVDDNQDEQASNINTK